jgi:thiol:disulfide interchange protein DsbD
MSQGLRSILFVLFSGVFIVAWNQNHVQWYGKYDPSSQQIVVSGLIDSTWHIYSPKTDAGLGPIALSIRLIAENGIKKQGNALFSPEPEAHMDENFGGTVYIWEKEVTIFQKVKFPKTCKEIKAIINYMICDDTQCLPPIDVELKIPFNP